MNHEGFRKHEGHEGTDSSRYRMRRASVLTPEEERVMRDVIGAAIAVHRTLGPGFLESIYRRAMCVELAARRLTFEVERPVAVEYRGVSIPGQRIDLIVEHKVIVELKAVTRFDNVHIGQVISYLKTTGLRGGLLINFRVPLLRRGLKRIVL
jgi:GxxExxY protein